MRPNPNLPMLRFRSLRFALYAASLAIAVYPAFAADQDGYAGSESCEDCHDAQTEGFAKTVHGHTTDKRSPGAEHGCETCHGPRADHVRKMEGKVPDDDIEAVVNMAVCLECHDKGKLALWPGSKHETRDVKCMDCHSIHGGNDRLLAAKTETGVCSDCHKDVRAELLRTSHHPIREGKMECSDCHNPHGTVADSLIDASTINEKCWSCHAEFRGPFLWEHAPVVEDCTSCHTPHGSSHTPLLVSRTPFLCQQCHSNSRHPGTLYAQPAGTPGTAYSNLNNRAYYRNCMNCHSQVHGSNHPSGKALAR